MPNPPRPNWSTGPDRHKPKLIHLPRRTLIEEAQYMIDLEDEVAELRAFRRGVIGAARLAAGFAAVWYLPVVLAFLCRLLKSFF